MGGCKNIILFILLSGLSLAGNSNSSALDSIQIVQLIEKGNVSLNHNLDSALYYLEKANAAATNSNYSSLAIEAEYKMAKVKEFKGEVKVALATFMRLLNHKKSSHDLKLSLYCDITSCYTDLRKFKQALEYGFKVISTLEKEPKTPNTLLLLARTYNTMGICYGEMDNIENAVKCFEKEKNIMLESNQLEHIATSYNNIGFSYIMLKDYDKAEEVLTEGLKYCSTDNSDEAGSIHESLSEMYIAAKQTDKALIHAAKAYQIGYNLKMNERIHFRKNLILSILGEDIHAEESKEPKERIQKENVVALEKNKESSSNVMIYLVFALIASNILFMVLYIRTKMR